MCSLCSLKLRSRRKTENGDGRPDANVRIHQELKDRPGIPLPGRTSGRDSIPITGYEARRWPATGKIPEAINGRSPLYTRGVTRLRVYGYWKETSKEVTPKTEKEVCL